MAPTDQPSDPTPMDHINNHLSRTIAIATLIEVAFGGQTHQQYLSVVGGMLRQELEAIQQVIDIMDQTHEPSERPPK